MRPLGVDLVILAFCGHGVSYTRAEYERLGLRNPNFQPRECDRCRSRAQPTRQHEAKMQAPRKQHRREREQDDWKRTLADLYR